MKSARFYCRLWTDLPRIAAPAALAWVLAAGYAWYRVVAGPNSPGTFALAVAAVLSAVAGAVACLWRLFFTDTAIRAQGQFVVAPAPPLQLYSLFDLGVADIDRDGRLDLYTSNHDGVQSYLLSRGDGSHEDARTRLGLDQDIDFPGMEDDAAVHAPSGVGLFIFFRGRCLVLHDRRPLTEPALTGTIRIVGNVTLRRAAHGSARLARRLSAGGITLTEIAFSLDAGGRIGLFVEMLGSPIEFALAENVALEQVHVGRGNRHPATRQFRVLRRDRHGHAWADINGDGRLDVFIGRGGYRGQIEAMRRLAGAGFAFEIEDEMLVRDGEVFADRAAVLGLRKGSCRTRGAAWVDVDNSGRLALYVNCLAAKNQLYMRDATGRFVDRAGEAGIDIAGSFAFVWVDLDRDGRPDLVIDEGDAIRVYYNEGKLRFRRVTVAHKPQRFEAKLSVADFDNSGWPSIVLATPRGLLLLVNRGGALQQEDPQRLGLPADGLSAHWVDYDNDGLVDLLVVPHGLFRQTADHRFEQAGDIRIVRPAQSVESLVQWYDRDNSGFRDAIVALRRPLPRQARAAIRVWHRLRSWWVDPAFLPQLGGNDGGEGSGFEYYVPGIDGTWSATLLQNRGNANHWLELVLEGAGFNREAIGAVVTVQTGSRRQTQGVGWADGAVYSQGHYRLYFGLGQATAIDLLQVRWSTGEITELTEVAADRVLQLRQGEPPAAASVPENTAS
jgi:hypothetical protein